MSLSLWGHCAVKDGPHTPDLDGKDWMCCVVRNHRAGLLEAARGSHSGSNLHQVLCLLNVPNTDEHTHSPISSGEMEADLIIASHRLWAWVEWWKEGRSLGRKNWERRREHT